MRNGSGTKVPGTRRYLDSGVIILLTVVTAALVFTLFSKSFDKTAKVEGSSDFLLQNTNQNVPLIPVSMLGLKGVIFPAERGQETAIETVGGYFTPAVRDVEQLGSKLRLYLETMRDNDEHHSKDAREILERYSDYRCQYIGYWENGSRKMLINCFSIVSFTYLDDYWYRAWIGISDGGSSVWRALYDMESGRVEHFRANGTG